MESYSATRFIKKAKELLKRQKEALIRARDSIRRKDEELETVKEILSLNYVTSDPDVQTVIRLLVARCVQEIKDYLSDGTLPDWVAKERQVIATLN